MTSMNRILALALCVVLTVPGCATTGLGTNTRAAAPGQQADPAVLGEYVQKLPAGSAVQVTRTGGKTVRGTLMKATGTYLVIQPKVRLPEPPIEIPLGDVLSVTPDRSNGNAIGKAIGIGLAAGAGAALVVFGILVAILD